MAGMFGSQYNDTKVMINDLSNISDMYSEGKPSSDEGIMKAPKGEQIDAGSWWAWLNGYTRQKTQENIARVQEELTSMGVDTTGLSPEYQQSMLEGIAQAKAYRDKWNITTALGDAPTMLEEQGVFPQTSVEQPVGVAEEDLDANEMPEKPSLMDRAISMFTPSEPEPDSVDTSKPEAGGIMAKPEPEPSTDAAKGMSFLKFVAKGEGGYNSSNRGTKENPKTKKKEIQGSSHNTMRGDKKLTEMTIAEIREKQKITDPDNEERLFAVGKYQLIPSTFEIAVKGLGLSADTVFDADTQEKLGQYLLFKKRPALGAYIRGESNDMNKALVEAAKEWASLPMPSGPKKGKSRYGSGNKAQHSLEDTIKALTAARTAYMESAGAGPTEDIVRPRLRDDK